MMNIENANIYNVQRLARDFTSKMTNRQRGKVVQAGGISVGEPSIDFIRAALAAQGINQAAVDKAQQLMASGQLDTPENIQQAADNIVEFGI
ncbi:MAG: hypothetical protein FVQ82_01285 [Planctomycetes bacterium]|nr:hypothetical protein [Planctomycetota bacterium]